MMVVSSCDERTRPEDRHGHGRHGHACIALSPGRRRQVLCVLRWLMEGFLVCVVVFSWCPAAKGQARARREPCI